MVLIALQVLSYLPLLDGGYRTTVNRSILASVTPGDRSALLRFGQTLYCFLSLGAIVIALLLMAGYSFTPMAVKSGQTPTFFLAVGLSGAPRAE